MEVVKNTLNIKLSAKSGQSGECTLPSDSPVKVLYEEFQKIGA